MFATLLGALPRPPLPDESAGAGRSPGSSGIAPRLLDALVRRVLEAQASAGLELLTDGRLRWLGPFGPAMALEGIAPQDDGLGPMSIHVRGLPTWRRPLAVADWRFAAAEAGMPVKQALPGPYTLARRARPAVGAPAPDIDATGFAFAAALRAEIGALAEAGCPVIEIEEADAQHIGADPLERRRFRDLHAALTDGLTGVHLSLAITGGSADGAGAETMLAAPYASLAVDLIDGPDNWRLVRAAPGERGIVCGALSARPDADEGPELLLWAAAYAASSNGRGAARTGLATSGSLAHLPWPDAERKLRRLGDAVRIAALPEDAALRRLDPRAVDIRSAAAGEYRPVPARTRPRPKR